MVRFEVVCTYLRVLSCDDVLYADVSIIDYVHVSYLYGSVWEFGCVGFEHRCVTQLTEGDFFRICGGLSNHAGCSVLLMPWWYVKLYLETASFSASCR